MDRVRALYDWSSIIWKPQDLATLIGHPLIYVVHSVWHRTQDLFVGRAIHGGQYLNERAAYL